MRFGFCQIALCLTLAGCGQATAKSLDSNDDMHCAAVMWRIGKVNEADATDLQRKSVAAVQAWYFAKLSKDRFEAENNSVLELIGRHPREVVPVAQECFARARADKEFAPFARFAIQHFD